MHEVDIALVGAGMAAASAARSLADAGMRVVVIDKARGPGGRCATRRGTHAEFDHGAQYFTARDDRFVAALQALPMAAACASWQGRVGAWDGAAMEPASPQPRRVGVPGMSAMVRALLSGLPQLYAVRVASLHRAGDRWHLLDEGGSAIASAATVILTAPPAQCSDLLGEHAPALSALCASVRMRPCWAVLAAFSERVPIDHDGIFVNRDPLSWCARNSAKPGRPAVEAWVLHAAPGWSESHLESSVDTVAEALLQAFESISGVALPATLELYAHRWRYALADEPLQVSHAWDSSSRLGLAGDWLAGSRVEGAWLSGRQLADQVIAHLQA